MTLKEIRKRKKDIAFHIVDDISYIRDRVVDLLVDAVHFTEEVDMIGDQLETFNELDKQLERVSFLLKEVEDLGEEITRIKL